jgi:tetratricopeptide (TPR) repeat protein
MGWFRSPFARVPEAPPSLAPAPPVTAGEWKARGNAAVAGGQLAEAARCYEQGVLADASDASLRLNLGFALLEQGEFGLAADRLLQALTLRRPADDFAHEAHYLLGRAYAGLARPAEALRSFEAALAIHPEFAEAVAEGAHALGRLQRHGEAAEWARRLVALRPAAFTRMVLAQELARSGQETEAAELFALVCAEDPANTEASLQRFNVLFRLARFGEALAEAQRLLALTGRTAGALVNIAAAQGRLGRADEALAAVEEALRLEPALRDALVNRAGLLSSLGRVEEAIDCARAGLRLYPDNGDLHWNLAISLLLAGDFEAGWAEHEWRDRSGPPLGTPPEFAQARWRGESLEGRAILLYGEQGFGDNIQFVRFVPEIARRAGVVHLKVLRALEPLMTDLPANCKLLPHGAPLPPADFHCPLLSLPAVLRTTEATIPAQVPYLRAEPARVQAWRERLPAARLKVGIAWSGKPTHFNDLNRSMTLAMFREAAAEGCQFVTVQPQLRDADRASLELWPELLDCGRELRDFADTAALIEALDLVISVDTSVAHLAGALAKPVWILLPHPPDWRWMLEREDTPWYPGARLYRQGAARSWPQVLARVQTDLAVLARR